MASAKSPGIAQESSSSTPVLSTNAQNGAWLLKATKWRQEHQYLLQAVKTQEEDIDRVNTKSQKALDTVMERILKSEERIRALEIEADELRKQHTKSQSELAATRNDMKLIREKMENSIAAEKIAVLVAKKASPSDPIPRAQQAPKKTFSTSPVETPPETRRPVPPAFAVPSKPRKQPAPSMTTGRAPSMHSQLHTIIEESASQTGFYTTRSGLNRSDLQASTGGSSLLPRLVQRHDQSLQAYLELGDEEMKKFPNLPKERFNAMFLRGLRDGATRNKLMADISGKFPVVGLQQIFCEWDDIKEAMVRNGLTKRSAGDVVANAGRPQKRRRILVPSKTNHRSVTTDFGGQNN